MMRPGLRLRAFAARICSARTMERLVDPIVADLQCEYWQARQTRGAWRARLVLAGGYVAFWKAVVWVGLRSACGFGGGEHESPLRRAGVLSMIAFVLVTVLFVLPPLLDGTFPGGRGVTVLLSLTLVPQALPLSLPAGVCIGVLAAMRARRPVRRDLLAVLLIGMAAAIAAAAIIEWLVPIGNQTFRYLVLAQLRPDQSYHLEPGLNEIGLSGLARRTDPVGVRQFHLVSALCFAAIPLALLALGLAGYVKRFAVAVILAVLAVIAYPVSMIMLTPLSPTGFLPPLVEAWVPNLLLLAVAAAMLWKGRFARSGEV